MISRLLSLAGMIILARIVGQTQFGEFGMVYATLGVAGIMAGFGLGSTATRFVAQHCKADPARAGRIIALITAFSLVLALSVALGVVLGAAAIARAALHAEHLQTAIVLGTLMMITAAIRGLQSGVLAGVERFDVIAKLNVLEGVASFVGLIGFGWIWGIEGALLGLATGALLAWVAGQQSLQKSLAGLKIAVRFKGSWRERAVLTGYSLPSFIASALATPVLWYCMTLVTNRVAGYDDLARYNAAYQWHGPLIFLPLILLSVSAPVLVQQWEQGSLQKFRKVFMWNAGLMLAGSALPAALIAVLSPWIMSLYGSGFRDGWPILILLVSAAPIHAMAKMASTALLGMNRAWSVAALNGLWGVTMLVAASILTPSLGALGLSVAFLAAYLILMASTTALLFWYLRGSQRALAAQAEPGAAR